MVRGVPDELLAAVFAFWPWCGAATGDAPRAAGGEVDGGQFVGRVVERASVSGGGEDGDAEVSGGEEGIIDGLDVGVGEGDLRLAPAYG